jgi:2,4-dienoyl-CoA reductase (NADPH2)
MLGELGKNFGKSTRWGMIQDVERFGVKTRTAARVIEITVGHVKIECENGIEEIAADTVVLAVGTLPHNPLQELVAAGGIPFRIAGDALQPAMVFDAVHQGFIAGREIG